MHVIEAYQGGLLIHVMLILQHPDQCPGHEGTGDEQQNSSVCRMLVIRIEMVVADAHLPAEEE